MNALIMIVVIMMMMLIFMGLESETMTLLRLPAVMVGNKVIAEDFEDEFIDYNGFNS